MNNIAICISGQTRTAIESYKSFLNYFNFDADIFYHTWETSHSIQQTLYDTYKPVRFKIEKCPNFLANDSFRSMLYSMYVANHLKKEEEDQRKKRYDLVIRMRFDLIFSPLETFNIIKPVERTIYSINENPMILGYNPADYEHHSINDIFFYGDSVSIDIATATYKHFETQCIPIREQAFLKTSNLYIKDSSYSPSILQYRHLTNRNVHIINKMIQCTIFRNEISHLDPISNYQEISTYNSTYIKERLK